MLHTFIAKNTELTKPSKLDFKLLEVGMKYRETMDAGLRNIRPAKAFAATCQMIWRHFAVQTKSCINLLLTWTVIAMFVCTPQANNNNTINSCVSQRCTLVLIFTKIAPLHTPLITVAMMMWHSTWAPLRDLCGWLLPVVIASLGYCHCVCFAKQLCPKRHIAINKRLKVMASIQFRMDKQILFYSHKHKKMCFVGRKVISVLSWRENKRRHLEANHPNLVEVQGRPKRWIRFFIAIISYKSNLCSCFPGKLQLEHQSFICQLQWIKQQDIPCKRWSWL